MPAIQKALGDDFAVLPFSRLTADGRPSVPVGAFGAMVNARSKWVDEAKEFVRWLWIEKPDSV